MRRSTRASRDSAAIKKKVRDLVKTPLSVMFFYAGNNSSYYTQVGSNASAFADLGPRLNVHANNSSATTRPDLAVINSNTAFRFIGSNNDFMSLTNALSLTSSVDSIGVSGIIVPHDFAVTHLIYRNLSNATNLPNFIVQTLNTGKIRVGTRRIGSDSTVNYDSSYTLTVNTPHYFMAETNY